jgi:hypothetical protein
VRVFFFFFSKLPNPSGRTKSWIFIQPLTEISTRSRKIMFMGSKVSRLSRQCASLNISTILTSTIIRNQAYNDLVSLSFIQSSWLLANDRHAPCPLLTWWFLAQLILRPWRWGWCVPPKCQLTQKLCCGIHIMCLASVSWPTSQSVNQFDGTLEQKAKCLPCFAVNKSVVTIQNNFWHPYGTQSRTGKSRQTCDSVVHSA